MAKNNELEGSFFLKNDHVFSAPGFSSKFLKTGINVYEVIRVIDAVPLFLEDHCKRFSNSLKGKGIAFDCASPILRMRLEKLIEKNKLKEGNIKIVYHFEPLEESFLILYPVHHIYPTKKGYKTGVFAVSLEEERPDPEFKNWRPDFKKRVKDLKKSTGAFEIILMSRKGIITEGSQSNLFFLKGDKIITAKRERILHGITRKYVYEICRKLGVEIIETDFTFNEIIEFESAFISGTSPKILPLKTIDDTSFNPDHPLLRKIMEEYDRYILKYISETEKLKYK